MSFLIDEDFNKTKSVANAGTDLSTKLDTYTTLSGWTGSKVFSGYANSGPGGVKLGSAVPHTIFRIPSQIRLAMRGLFMV